MLFYMFLILALLCYISTVIFIFELPSAIYSYRLHYKKIKTKFIVIFFIMSLLLTLIFATIVGVSLDSFDIAVFFQQIAVLLLALGVVYLLRMVYIFTKLDYSKLIYMKFFVKELIFYLIMLVCSIFAVKLIYLKIIPPILIAILVTIRLLFVSKKFRDIKNNSNISNTVNEPKD